MKRLTITIVIAFLAINIANAQKLISYTTNSGQNKVINLARYGYWDYIVDAVSINISGNNWTKNDILALSALQSASMYTIESYDMSQMTFAQQEDISFEGFFNNYYNLKEVTFPTKVQTNPVYMYSAFMSCQNLERVNNIHNLENITNLSYAFSDCSSLKELTLTATPNTKWVEIIGAFQNCKSLERVHNFDSFKNITYKGIFTKCSSLKEIHLGIDPNKSGIISSDKYLMEFVGVPKSCIKHLPLNVVNVPVIWENYKGFVAHISDYQNSTIENGGVTYNKIVIDKGATLTVNAPVNIDTLIVTVSQDSYSSIESADNIDAKVVEMRKYIDSHFFYFLSVPFDINMKDVIALNSHLGAYGKDWIMKEYDEKVRAEQGKVPNAWRMLEHKDKLLANKGYTAALASGEEKILRFRKESKNYSAIEHNKKVKLKSTNGCSPVDMGWHLVSIPNYASEYFTISHKEMYDIFINIPNVHGTDGYRQVRSSEYKFRANEPVFVQVRSGDLSFELSQNPQRSTNLGNPQSNATEIFISNGHTEDRATVLQNDTAPDDIYLPMHDLEKLTTYRDGVHIFVNDHAMRLAVSTLNNHNNRDISLGVYVPTTGIHTLSLVTDENYVIYDALLDIESYLGEYQFDASTTGIINDRFFLRVANISTDCDNIETDNITITSQQSVITLHGTPVGASINVYTAAGQLVDSDQAISTTYTVDVLNPGVYTVVVTHKGQGTAYKAMVK